MRAKTHFTFFPTIQPINYTDERIKQYSTDIIVEESFIYQSLQKYVRIEKKKISGFVSILLVKYNGIMYRIMMSAFKEN